MSGVPAVEGYSIAPIPADDVLWLNYGFPAELTLNHALVVGADGGPVGRLIVASATTDRPAIDTFVEHSFAGQVNLPLDVADTPNGTIVVMNGAHPVWTEMEGNAVMRAEQPIDHNFQWAWGAGALVWIVRGNAGAEAYVRALLRVHATTLDPFDFQGMVGALWDHTPSVPGYKYHDLTRVQTLGNMARGFPEVCSERFYLGIVLPDGAAATDIDTNNMWLSLEKAGGRCVFEGVVEETAALIASGRRAEQIGGLIVFRDEQFSVALVGDVLITFYSTNPQTYVDMAPFIEPFFAGQPR